MLQIFLILFIIFVVVPIVRGIWTVYKLRRQAREAFSRFAAAGQQQAPRRERPEQRKAGWQAAPTAKKKISADEGEYIAYEEITVVSAESQTVETDDGRTRIVEEQQIVDVEWEDIK